MLLSDREAGQTRVNVSIRLDPVSALEERVPSTITAELHDMVSHHWKCAAVLWTLVIWMHTSCCSDNPLSNYASTLVPLKHEAKCTKHMCSVQAARMLHYAVLVSHCYRLNLCVPDHLPSPLQS